MEASVSTYVLEDLGNARRVLAWLDPNSDRIGNVMYPRNTPGGLSAHLTDDPNTVGDTSIEAIVNYLAELVDAGLVERDNDGTYTRTAAGSAALGGVVYADAHAAGLVTLREDGSGYEFVDAPAEAPAAPVEDVEPPAEGG